MRKLFLVPLIWLTIHFEVNCQVNEINPNGYNVFKYPNGQISSEGTMKDGKPDGFWKTYYVNGKLKSEGKRRNYLLDSIWNFYNEKGDTTLKINYLYGFKNGWYYTYKSYTDSAGIHNYLYSRELYVEDKKQGPAYYYYPNGKPFLSVFFKNGRQEGEGREYNTEGLVISILQFRNDILIDKEPINRKDQNNLKHGVWKEYYPNEKLKSEVTYKNDKFDGYFKQYDDKGRLIKSDRYINGELVVIKQETQNSVKIKNEYFNSGSVKTSGGFKENIPVGVHREFSEEGKVVGAKTFSDEGILTAIGIVDEAGNKQNEWKEFYETGQIKAIGKYKNNKREGDWLFYFSNGKIEQKGKYKNGKPEGKWIWYYENSKILREEEFINGKEDGILTEYREDGAIITKGEYIEGLKTGQWIYSVGENIEEGKYKNDLPEGEWKRYFTNKKLAFIGSYLQGDAHGKHIYYYESGNEKIIAYYQLGKKDGTWIWYDEAGKPIISITYKKDEEMKVDGSNL